MKAIEKVFDMFNSLVPIPEEEELKFKKIFYNEKAVKDEILWRAGDNIDTFSFIDKGLVKLFFIDLEGKEHVKSFRVSGQLSTDYRALISKKSSLSYCQALTECEFISAKYADFEELMESHFCWQKIARIITQKEFLLKEERESQFLTMTVQERYFTFKEEFRAVYELIPQYLIASYLGIAPQSLSRIIAKKK